MKLVIRVATVSLMLLTLSCDAYNWPPYENQLRSMFLESKSVLTEIESEMIADGLVIVGPRPQRLRSGQPELTADQVNKYKNLFERLPYHWNLLRSNGTTIINAYGPNPWGLGKSFSYKFVHKEEPANLPSCEVAGWTLSCGICALKQG